MNTKEQQMKIDVNNMEYEIDVIRKNMRLLTGCGQFGESDPMNGQCTDCMYDRPKLYERCEEFCNQRDSLLSWDKICERADGAAHLSPALKAKDEARGQTRDLMLELHYPDPEDAEIPEEMIEQFCKKKDCKFDSSGNLRFHKNW